MFVFLNALTSHFCIDGDLLEGIAAKIHVKYIQRNIFNRTTHSKTLESFGVNETLRRTHKTLDGATSRITVKTIGIFKTLC